MQPSAPPQLIGQNYDSRYHAQSCQPHTSGGFSGAMLWRVTCPAGEYCWRRWPTEHPTRERLQWIHRLLYHAYSQGFKRLALPVLTRRGETIVEHAGHLWELSPWLPGEAKSPADIQLEQIHAALIGLAEFHGAMASHKSAKPAAATCPAIDRRLAAMQQFDSWAETLISQSNSWPRGLLEHTTIQQILTSYLSRRESLRRELQAASKHSFATCPCLRDVWSEHVLFAHGKVSGLIDYGAMAADVPATDIARLLGSYAGNDHARWRAGLAGYQTLVPLDRQQIQLVALLDLSSAVLSGMNWLDWLYIQSRTFDDLPAVRSRVESIVARLSKLPVSALDHWAGRSGSC